MPRRRARPRLAPAAALVVLGLLAMTAALGRPASAAAPGLTATSFAALTGWRQDDQLAALDAFMRSCAKPAWPSSERAGWQRACDAGRQALAARRVDVARRFFEERFVPYAVHPAGSPRGFLTGYYEPEVAASRRPAPGFNVPVYRKPPDLVTFSGNRRPAGIGAELTAGRRTPTGRVVPYWTRRQIDAGALRGQGLEIAYLRDPVDAFFIHVQGSARLRMTDGSVTRIGFAAKNGQPYTSIGKVLVREQNVPAGQMTMQWIRSYFAANPQDVGRVTANNDSYIFFREIEVTDPRLGPVGAQGVALTPGRSLAIDRAYHTLGTPIWLTGTVPASAIATLPFRRLMVAQDTGSAIKGPARGDIFYGSGDAPGELAGLTRHAADFYVLLPKGLGAARR